MLLHTFNSSVHHAAGCCFRALPGPKTRAPPNDGARDDYVSSSAFQYASLMNFDQLSILEACLL